MLVDYPGALACNSNLASEWIGHLRAQEQTAA